MPQFYLRGFAKDGHVVVIADGRARRLGLRKATVERDAYALIDNEGLLYQGFEDHHFSNVERIAASSHRLLADRKALSGIDWLSYVAYLALGVVRTRRAATMSAQAMSAELVALAPPGSREQRRIHMDNMFFRLWPRVIWVLGQLDWRLSELPEDLPLITADHPLGVWTDRQEDVRQLGLLDAPLLVHPIDRHRALWFKKPIHAWPAWMDDPWQVAGNANWAMIQIASPEIIVHPDDVQRFQFAMPGGSGSLPGVRVHIARGLPLWLPTALPIVRRPSWEVEALLKRSARSRFQGFLAHELGLSPGAVIAAISSGDDVGECAAIVQSARGIQVWTGTVERRAAA